MDNVLRLFIDLFWGLLSKPCSLLSVDQASCLCLDSLGFFLFFSSVFILYGVKFFK